MNSKVNALKDLYTALGGDSASVLGANSVIAVLNGILALGSVDGCQFVPDAIKAIADNLSSIDPSPSKESQNKTVTPSTTEQAITADSGKVLGTVTVEAVTAAIDANITAENIKDGITILGVVGTYDGQ